MKNMKPIITLLLAFAMILPLALSACGNSGTPVYSVTVKDALGAPYTSGVIVRFMQNGQQVAMQTIDENGVASKELPAGNYTVELMFTSDDEAYSYDSEGLELTADKTSLEIILSQGLGESSQTLYAGNKEIVAYNISTGSTGADLKAGRNYFLFTPTVAGTYEFSLIDTQGTIGYYGAPHFIQNNNVAENGDDTSFTISVKANMIGTSNTGTAVYVIGVDVDADTSGILAVERIGDPEHTIEDEPWTVYETTAQLRAYTLPEGSITQDFDLKASTDTYKLVLGSDGFYHLDSQDGPLVLAKIGEKADVPYLDPFQIILDHSGVVKYFFDENGEFVKKENYSDCLMEYFEYVDEDTGLYPLTEDLKYIIQQRGEYSGWFDPEESLYLFKDENMMNIVGINNDISWLFMCCYIEQ